MKRCRLYILVLISFFSTVLPTAGAGETGNSFTFPPTLQKAYAEIQKLRLTNARKILDTARKSNPANGLLIYLDNYADTFYLLISEDRAAYQNLSPLQDARISQLASLPGDSPYQRFLQAEIRLHWAFVKLKFGSEISACWDIIRAYRLLEENKKKYPAFAPTLKSLGLLHVLIGSVPEKYTWVTRVLGLKGDIGLGLRELREARQQAPAFRFETELIDLLIHAYTLGLSDRQSHHLLTLPEANPDHLLAHFFAASILMKQARAEEALAILHKAPEGAAYLPFPILDYLEGEILLQKGEYTAAFGQFQKFLDNTRGVNFIRDSYFKQFLAKWLSGRTAEAEQALSRIDSKATGVVEADKYAIRFAGLYRSGQVPEESKILFKARYACDGGFFRQAASLLENHSEQSFTRIASKAEFNYRKARILQQTKSSPQAVDYFRRAIALSEPAGLYFGAAAALQLGYIYRQEGNNAQAASYFRKAMSFKKHEYKNSIDNKALAALTAMKADNS